jgi:hypothetical protein
MELFYCASVPGGQGITFVTIEDETSTANLIVH